MERSEAVSYLKGCIEDYLRRKGLPTDGKTLFTCLSTDHPDKHPSMCYYKEGKMVRCFGCHAKFDIFDLIVLLFWFLRKGGDGVRNLFGGTKGDRGDALPP